jgi:hypothetical protein
MIDAVTAVSAAAILFIALRIWLFARQHTVAQQRAARIAGIELFVVNRNGLSAHLGLLCYWALLGRNLNIDAPGDGLSLLLDALRDKDAGSSRRLKDHPLAAQFRPKLAIIRSPEMLRLFAEIEDFVTLANDSGCPTMVEDRITDLYAEVRKTMTSIRGPG